MLKAGASEESRAAADPLALGTESQGISARTIFTGFGIGLAYKALNVAFKGWRDAPNTIFGAPLKGGSISAEIYALTEEEYAEQQRAKQEKNLHRRAEEDGGGILHVAITGDDGPESLGFRGARQLRELGAEDLLARARKQV